MRRPLLLVATLLLATAAPALAEDAPAATGKKKKKAAEPKPADAKPADAKPAAAPPATSPGTSVGLDADYGPSLPAPAVVRVVPPMGRGRVWAGARLGLALPQAVSNFNSTFLVGIEAGYLLPRLPGIGEGLAVSVDLAFSAPQAGGSVGASTFSVTENELSLGITALYRAPFFRKAGETESWLTPYLGVGVRFFFLQSAGSLAMGSGFSETSNAVGFHVPLGVDLKLWKFLGSAFAEADLAYGPFTHNTTGASNAGSFSIVLGYRVFFGLGG